MVVRFSQVFDKVKEVSLVLDLPQVPKLIAVSKFHSVQKICEAIDQGADWFGESYLKELEEKYLFFKSKNINVHWSFIGKLQSNKISKIVEYADEIQSVENMKHVRYISRYAHQFGKIPYPIYIELNLEDQKAGISYNEIEKLYNQIMDSEFKDSVSVEGIMCVPPIYEESISIEDIKQEKDRLFIPQVYKDIYEFSQTIGNKKLSLGMSSDMITSILVGSSCLRIGTEIFGQRTYPVKSE